MEKKFLSAEEILAIDDIEFVEVWVPEWKTMIILRMLNGEEAIEFTEQIAKDKSAASARMLILSAVQEDRKTPLFTEAHFQALKKKSLKAMIRLQKMALKINGFNEKELEEAKNV